MNIQGDNEEINIMQMCHRITSNMSIMDFEGLGTEYYADDCDKYHDLPIDQVWESQQISTFTAWCNAHLRKADMKIEVFEQDFRNGLKLIKLLELISNEVLPAPDKGKMRLHKISNVNKALKFIEEKGVKIDSVGAEEIVDGNIKMTLGMIWTIILKFTIQDILVEDSSAKEGLLLWCKRQTNGYKNVRVNNFNKSFQNGLAFCALLHNHDSQLIDYDILTPEDARHNLTLAFTVADRVLDIPQMLSVNDMISNNDSDDRSIMTYVSSYYHAFNRRNKIKAAVSNIEDMVTARMYENNHIIDYHKIANDLLSWIEMMTQAFEDRRDIDDHSCLVSKVKFFEQYKFLEKPNNQCCQIKLQFATINNDALVRKEELIGVNWCRMEEAECVYEAYLSEQRHREDHIENLLSQFDIKFQSQTAWIDNNTIKLLSTDYETADLCQLRTLLRGQDTFIADFNSQESRIGKLVKIADELRQLYFNNMKTIDEKVNLIVRSWETMRSLNSQRVQSINVRLNVLIQLDDLQLNFANRVTPLFNWIRQSNQDLNDKFILHFLDQIKDLLTAHESFTRTVYEALDEFNDVKSLSNQIGGVIKSSAHQKIPRNPYTDITINDLETAWIELDRNIQARDNFLRDSLARQAGMTDCHSVFTKKIETIASVLHDIQDRLFETLSRAINSEKKELVLRQLNDRLNHESMALDELDIVYQRLDGYSKIDCSRTILSRQQIAAIRDTLDYLIMEGLRLGGNEHTNSLTCTKLPPNKIQDYEACFRHFDRHNSGQLDLSQFRACLLALGFYLEEDGKGNESFEQLLCKVDPNRSGHVSLDSFLEFMTRQSRAKYSQDSLLESFRVLSNNQRSICRDTIGQKLPSTVANYCLRNMKPYFSFNGDSDDGLDYDDFVTRLGSGTCSQGQRSYTH